jgi:hypothetical protein
MEKVIKLCETALLFVGAAFVLHYVHVFVGGIYARLFRSGKNIEKSYGKWAIVTGNIKQI